MEPNPLLRRTFDAALLVREHPPAFTARNKVAVQERLGKGDPPRGTLELTRWSEAALPVRRPKRRPVLLESDGFYQYGQVGPAGTMHWHVNFAMSECFGAYAGDLLAQDELQVLEHPILGSLREAADEQGRTQLRAAFDRLRRSISIEESVHARRTSRCRDVRLATAPVARPSPIAECSTNGKRRPQSRLD